MLIDPQLITASALKSAALCSDEHRAGPEAEAGSEISQNTGLSINDDEPAGIGEIEFSGTIPFSIR